MSDGYTLLQLRTEVLARGFDASLFPSSRINQYLNDGLREMCRKIRFQNLEVDLAVPTVANQALYAYPADMNEMRGLRNTADFYTVERRPLDEFDWANTNTAGKPRYYALDTTGYRLYPKPDAIYPLSLRYWKLPTLMVADGDYPGSVPTDYHNELLKYALYQCYEGEDDVQMSSYYQQAWNSSLKDMAVDVKFPDSDNPHQVQGMWNEDGMPISGWGLGW